MSELVIGGASALHELEAYKFALDASSILAITDRRGRISYCNDKFCEISKYPREELLGQDHRILNSGHHPREFFQELWRTISAGKVWKGDICNRAKDGTIYWVHTTITAVMDRETGKPEHYLAVRNEITERKTAQAELEETVKKLETANRRIKEEHAKLLQAEKMASVGLLAAGVAHEINNPLSGVMACVKALSEDRVKPQRKEEYFRTSQDGLERIQQIVRGLLDFSRQRPPSHADLPIDQVVEACVRLIVPVTRKQAVEIVLEEALRTQLIRADRSQLMQALVNLLLNATYVSPRNSEITVGIRRKTGLIGIAIEDEGPGMSEEVMQRACDPFFTTKPEGEGTGLGLAVTASIAQGHGGELELSSREEGLGACVTIWLPEGNEENVRT